MSSPIYSWDEIKQRGDCIRFVREVLGIEISGDNRCAAPWRGGTRENSVSLETDKFFDFAANEGGSIIDLCAVSKFDGDTFAAASFLGEWLGLKPKTLAKENGKIVATYDYTDIDGNLILQVVRYEPKDFKQRAPIPGKPGEWKWAVKDILPPLYRLSELRAAKWVCIVGGEKDVNNLREAGIAATCNAGGEGKWRDEYNVEFTGKNCVIIADKDDTGRRHAQAVAFAIRNIAKSVRVIELPDRDAPVKDASDWLAAGGTKEEFSQIISGTPKLDPAKAEPPRETQKELSAAKKANSRPFSNYDWIEGEDERGNPKPTKQPRKVMDMVRDLKTRFWNFPAKLGETLFDHDRATNLIRSIESSPSLLTWIAEKSNFQVDWARKVEGCTTAEEFFYSVKANSRSYNMISGVPNWPTRDDVYYTHGKLPDPDPEMKAFNTLMRFFNPHSKVDELLLRVLFASPIYFRYNVPRPMWIIDSEHGQGTGKTKLVEMLSLLYGSEDNSDTSPIYVDHQELNSETQYERIMRRLLSQSARRKRVVLIDNVTGHYNSASLARLCTQSHISGLAPYGRDEETRPMDLTICMTANSATMDRDLIHRSFIVFLTKPEVPMPNWVKEVTSFITANRLQILSDVCGALQRGAKFQSGCVTRCRDWEQDVMLPMLGSQEAHSLVWKECIDRGQSSDSTVEEADILKKFFGEKLANLGLLGKDIPVWLPSRVLTVWSMEAIKGFGGINGRSAAQALHNMVKNGTITEMSREIKFYPPSGIHRSRGLMWNQDAVERDFEPRIVHLNMDGTVSELTAARDDLGL
jgi:hypothetical protein